MKKSVWALSLVVGWLASTTVVTAAETAAAKPLVHINIAGPEFAGSVLPGRPGYDYMFPSAASLDRWKAEGVQVFRLPIKWERLQPTLNAPLDEVYAKLIDTAVQRAADRKMSLLLDIHNYGFYRKQVIGSAAVPLTAYNNLLQQISKRWGNSPGLHGYDIMNEPNGAADAGWPAAAQAAINGVRVNDKVKPIYVQGRSWSSASQWAKLNGPLLLLRDPSNNIIFSAHLYVDPNASGTYTAAAPANFDPNLGVQRATPFVEWLVRNNRKGHIGEFGVPGDDPRYLESMERLLSYLKTNCVPMAYWAAGPWGSSYKLSIEPAKDGQSKTQWSVLSKHIKEGSTCK